jgi:hypothetical protein
LTLPGDLFEQLALGKSHELDVRAAASRCNVVAQRLAVRIPRLEPVRDLLRRAGSIARGQEIPHEESSVWILRACIDYGQCLAAGLTPELAFAQLVGRTEHWPPELSRSVSKRLHALRAGIKRAVSFSDLVPGMIFVEPVITDAKLMLVPQETEVTEPLIEQLRNFAIVGRLSEPLWVREGEQ